MYHKNRRRRPRFYPEFYDDDEIEIKDARDDDPGAPQNSDDPPEKEIPANDNNLLSPNNFKPDSVFKQLENMQKDYMKKKLEVSEANSLDIYPDVTGCEENMSGNEAENINEEDSGIRVEIPDSMYTGEISELNNTEYENDDAGADNPVRPQNNQMIDCPYSNERRLSEVMQTIADINDTESPGDFDNLKIFEECPPAIDDAPETDEEYEEYILTPDSDDYSDDAVPTFGHIMEREQFAGDAVPSVPNTEPEPTVHYEPEPIITESEPIAQFEPIQEYNSKIIAFDKTKAVEYAHKWALARNPDFLDFDELGGDCTNYISQILLAGGCQMDRTPVYGWYYINGNEKSPSWTGVEQLYNYLTKEKEHGIIAKEINAEEAEAGDIVQFSFNGRNFQHTPFIVEISRSADAPFSYDSIKICAHSFDSQNRALDTYQWRNIRFIRILGYK